MIKGKLFLIPVPLGATPPADVLAPKVTALAAGLKYFVAENARTARAFLKTLPMTRPLREIEIAELNEHTPAGEIPARLAPLLAGTDAGLISEAGCPAVADPGSALVACAHAAGIRVVPLAGPSSVLLALMASGLSGQNFAFHGYLPVKEEPRRKRLLALEKDSAREKRTQVFIETPYRNRQMFQSLVAVCAPQTRICVASDLTLDAETVQTFTRAEWCRRAMPDIDRRPTVFLLHA